MEKLPNSGIKFYIAQRETIRASEVAEVKDKVNAYASPYYSLPWPLFLLKKIYIISIKSRKPILIGVIVFLVLTIITQLLTYHRYLRNQDQVLQKINQEADFVKDKLQAALSFSLSATKTLAFLVEEYGVPKDFASTAKEILEVQ